MKKYNHLSREQRYTIDRLLKSKASPILSLQKLLEWPLVLSLERSVGIKPLAEDIRIGRRRHMPRNAKNGVIIRANSPRRCGMKSNKLSGSNNGLYTFLHKDKESGGDLYRHTRYHLKYRHKPLASPQKGKKSIDERPDCIDRKERFGDFEMDLIIGAQQREAILTLTERKTGYAIIEKLPNGKNAKSLARVVNRSLAYFKRMGLLHSITTDNGSEFMAFRSIERALHVPVFFAKPYCSTDMPHVELLNKLIRQYIPKGTSFKDIDDKQIRNIRMLLNNRPRKSLDFKSPNEVLALLLSHRCT